MNLADTIYQKSLELPVDKAREVIDFIEFLKTRPPLVADLSEVKTVTSSASLLQLFDEPGLIGCIETDDQLATTYKEKLDFSHKHGSSS